MTSQTLKPGWKMVKFGDVVKNANLVERDPEGVGIERIVGLEHLDPENLHIRRWNTPENGTSFTRKFVPGQTLFGKRRAYQRKVAYAEFEGICSGDILTFEPKDKKVLLPELLPFICQSDAFFDHALGTSAGSLSPRTSWKALKDFEFPLPPIEEQKRIAEILWAADDAAEAYEKLLKEFEKLLLTTANSICWHKTLERQPIVKIVDVTTGNFIDGDWIESKDQSNKGIRLLQLADIGDGIFLNKSERFITKATFIRLKCTEVLPGDILISRMADPIGRACIVPEIDQKMITAVDCTIVRVNENKHDKKYWSYLMRTSRWKRKVESRAGGSTRLRISRKNLESITVPIPSFEFQKRSVLILDQIHDAMIRSLQHRNACRTLLITLREKLLGHRVGSTAHV